MMSILEKHKRLYKTVEALKTVLLALLVICLILLVIVYIGGTHVYETVSQKDSPDENFDKLWSVQSGAEPESLDGSRLLPEFIGYKQTASEPVGSIADHDAASELYALVKPCLLELFGSDSVCSELPAETGEQLFLAASASEEFIYLRYHVPVLYQLIYAYAADELTISESDVAVGESGSIGAYVSELIIIPDADNFDAHRFIAYASDSEGRYYEFRPGEHLRSSSFYISKLAERGADIATCPFSFSDNEQLSPTQPQFDHEIEYTHIAITPTEVKDNELTAPLLRLFGYNPDKLDGYTDNTAKIYVDSHSYMRLDDGSVTFVTNDASDNSMRGIEIDSMLGYSTDDTYNLFDKLTAVDNLIRRLSEISPSLVGGEASLCLGDVYSDGMLLVIEYVLTYNNIRIEGEPVLRAVLTQETICEISLNPVDIVTSDSLVLSPRQSFILRKLVSLGSLPETAKNCTMRLLYSSGDAKWAVSLAD